MLAWVKRDETPSAPPTTPEHAMYLRQIVRPGVRKLMTLAVLEDLCWDAWDDETRAWAFAGIEKIVSALPAKAVAPYAVANEVAPSFADWLAAQLELRSETA